MAPVIWITISDPNSLHAGARLFNPVWPLRSLLIGLQHRTNSCRFRVTVLLPSRGFFSHSDFRLVPG